MTTTPSLRAGAVRARLPLGATGPLVGLVVSLLSCGGSEAPEPPPLRPVRYEPVFATGTARVRSFTGVAQAGLESDLSFKVAGTVSAVPVEVGDEVPAGAVIARLDERDYELAVQQTRASLDRARAEARNASASYDRVRALYEEGNASRTELDNARAASEAAAAQFSATEKQLALAELQLGYCVLEAPVAGAIADVRVEASENVAAGQIVARLTSGARSEVQFGVPEVLITQVHEGDGARVTFDAIPGTTLGATVTEVGITSSGAATTFSVTALLNEPDERVRPGMAVEVSLSFDAGGGGERYLVPSVAVGEDRRGRYVFVVEDAVGDTAVVRRKAVEVGDLTGDGLEVYSGLEDGDLVVTAGVNRLTDGDHVRIPDRAAP